GTLDIAVFHGSREGKCPPGQAVTAPFSDAEVAASPFVYHAVGHYHVRTEIDQKPGAGTPSHGIRLACAGSPVALDYTENGDHGAPGVMLRFDWGGCAGGVEPLRLDRRRMLPAQVDVTGCASGEQIDRRIQHAFSAAGVTENDFVHLEVFGRLM